MTLNRCEDCVSNQPTDRPTATTTTRRKKSISQTNAISEFIDSLTLPIFDNKMTIYFKNKYIIDDYCAALTGKNTHTFLELCRQRLKWSMCWSTKEKWQWWPSNKMQDFTKLKFKCENIREWFVCLLPKMAFKQSIYWLCTDDRRSTTTTTTTYYGPWFYNRTPAVYYCTNPPRPTAVEIIDFDSHTFICMVSLLRVRCCARDHCHLCVAACVCVTHRGPSQTEAQKQVEHFH